MAVIVKALILCNTDCFGEAERLVSDALAESLNVPGTAIIEFATEPLKKVANGAISAQPGNFLSSNQEPDIFMKPANTLPI